MDIHKWTHSAILPGAAIHVEASGVGGRPQAWRSLKLLRVKEAGKVRGNRAAGVSVRLGETSNDFIKEY